MDRNDALEMVIARNMFYRRMHFLVLGAFAISLVVMGTLIFTIYYLNRNPPKPYYFAADNVGRLLQIIPVNTPNMTVDEVKQWTVKAVQAAFTYDYVNYGAQLQSAQKYFTNTGWRLYMKALTSSNNLVGVTQRKYVAIAKVVDDPVLEVQGILGGAYAWKFTLKVLVSVYGPPTYDEATKFANALTITTIVQRQKSLEGNNGLGIVQLISSLDTGGGGTPAVPQDLNSSQ